jgi:predicted aspartyl protease
MRGLRLASVCGLGPIYLPPAEAVAMTLRGLLFVTACLAPWVAPAAAACKLGLATTLPLTIAGPRLYVPVSVNETEGLFLVDTGAGETILTGAFAKKSGVGLLEAPVQYTIPGVGGRETLPIMKAHTRRVDIGTISFPDWAFFVVPTEAGGLGKTEHDGILGMDFMHYFDIDVDVEARKLSFWRVTGCTDIHPVWQGDYDAIPLKHTAGQNVRLPMFIDNAFLDIVLDTGAAGIVLTHGAALQAGATDAQLAHDPDPQSGGIGGKFPAVLHHFKLMLVGKAEFDNPAIVVETETHTSFYADGLMDWRYLKPKKFWLSYATNTLFVQSAPKP